MGAKKIRMTKMIPMITIKTINNPRVITKLRILTHQENRAIKGELKIISTIKALWVIQMISLMVTKEILVSLTRTLVTNENDRSNDKRVFIDKINKISTLEV